MVMNICKAYKLVEQLAERDEHEFDTRWSPEDIMEFVQSGFVLLDNCPEFDDLELVDEFTVRGVDREQLIAALRPRFEDEWIEDVFEIPL